MSSPVKCSHCQKAIHPSRITYAYNPATGTHDVHVDGFLSPVLKNFSKGRSWTSQTDRQQEKEKFLKDMTHKLEQIMKRNPAPNAEPYNVQYAKLLEKYTARAAKSINKDFLGSFAYEMHDLKMYLKEIGELTQKGKEDLTSVKEMCNGYYKTLIKSYDIKNPKRKTLQL